MNIRELIQFANNPNNVLARPEAIEGMPPMAFSCWFSSEAASHHELSMLPHNCPNDLLEFWSLTSNARLFEDIEYGQWGLRLVAPTEAIEMSKQCMNTRASAFTESDLVAGTFIGDSELVVVRCDNTADDFGAVIVANPIYQRGQWTVAAASFVEFFRQFINSRGDKFWERSPS